MCEREKGDESTKAVAVWLCLCQSYICLFVHSMGAFLLTFLLSFLSERFPNEDVPCGLKLWTCHVDGLDTVR